ncbi:MAG: YciI family protein [Burkholderiales bacterium]|nr:YciI family protein [Burkholderiales bacterium]
MLFAIIAEDVPGSLARRLEMRPAHVERLKALHEAGRLVLAGPHPAIEAEDPGPAGFTGSLIVAQFASRDAAIAWVAEDPYALAGVYARVSVKPFRKTLP